MADKESRGTSHFSVGKSANDQQRTKATYQSHGIIFFSIGLILLL